MSELKPSGRKKAVSDEKVEQFKRRLERSTEVHHDLFRLEVTDTVKNMSWNEDAPNWQPVKHGHFYHTVDSSGKALDNSVASAGHFHPVEVEWDGDTIKSIKCGPPMVMHKGKPHPYKNDKHIHEISYIASEKVEKRVQNQDAIKLMSITRKDEREAQQKVAGMLSRA